MKTALSPFKEVRWEAASPRLYFLSPDIRGFVERPRQAYLIGSRGTGKTTILQALNWKERLANSSLREQIGDPFGQGHLGLYLKLPDHQLDQLDWWLGASPNKFAYASVVSTYVDLLWLPLLIQALEELRVGGVLSYEIGEERAAVAAVMEELPSVYFDGSDESQRSPTLRNLRRSLERVRDLLVGTARRNGDANDLLDKLRPAGIGSFGRTLAAALVSLCPARESAADWRVFVCMDEGEGLNDRQQIVVNTMVRHAEAPVSFLVSYVARPREDTRTANSSIHLQRADRELIFRDDASDNRRSSFRELAEGVATVRVRQRLNDSTVSVDLDRLLGKLDVDAVLAEILRSSDKREARPRCLRSPRSCGKAPTPLQFVGRGYDSEVWTAKKVWMGSRGAVRVVADVGRGFSSC